MRAAPFAMFVASVAAYASLSACAGARAGGRTTELVIAPTMGSAPVVTAVAATGQRAPRVDDAIIRGIGGVEVGQTVAELRQRLGDELRVDSFDKEQGAFTTFGYDIGRTIPFILGFDSVLVFNDDTLRSDPPIWKVYVKDERAVVVKITTVGFDEYFTSHRIGFLPSCFLLDPPAGVFATFGQGFIEEQLSDHTTYHYVDRGLSVLVFNDAIRVFDVFGDVGGEAREKIRAALAKPVTKP